MIDTAICLVQRLLLDDFMHLIFTRLLQRRFIRHRSSRNEAFCMESFISLNSKPVFDGAYIRQTGGRCLLKLGQQGVVGIEYGIAAATTYKPAALAKLILAYTECCSAGRAAGLHA
jgi:hypothetical protein